MSSEGGREWDKEGETEGEEEAEEGEEESDSSEEEENDAASNGGRWIGRGVVIDLCIDGDGVKLPFAWAEDAEAAAGCGGAAAPDADFLFSSLTTLFFLGGIMGLGLGDGLLTLLFPSGSLGAGGALGCE